jgi:hypothetical protein
VVAKRRSWISIAVNLPSHLSATIEEGRILSQFKSKSCEGKSRKGAILSIYLFAKRELQKAAYWI